ncbi:hypothetical protein PRIPAC_88832 [Pristionchus pacificus]|uniref:Uncharacterized protein n=1 Tax=Pristionchus pacificus TaxID=54126 RepID=A0A2A6B9A4_PRIPA|nr:hypothetical protein PRIPAC_88832 [Pristionchus pacificus]|eukprot:PDM62444.1 hypothetical protein PRIPAC_51886 [Pristionchus pacificus]
MISAQITVLAVLNELSDIPRRRAITRAITGLERIVFVSAVQITYIFRKLTSAPTTALAHRSKLTDNLSRPQRHQVQCGQEDVTGECLGEDECGREGRDPETWKIKNPSRQQSGVMYSVRASMKCSNQLVASAHDSAEFLSMVALVECSVM